MAPLDSLLSSRSFLQIADRAELAQWLGITDKRLRYLLYAQSEDQRYKTFSIRKRNGQDRRIDSPRPFLKALQRKIADVLYDVSPPRLIAKGYIPGIGIAEMGGLHRGSRWVVAADLEAFFPSINFGRVRGLFSSAPFAFPAEVATVLAQLCCYNAALPQGAPSSPAISNIICRALDRELVTFAKRHAIRVSRYADDIVLSFSFKDVPNYVASASTGKWVLSSELTKIIESSGFRVNNAKTRVMHRSQRQLVTGLVVNKKPQMPREWRRMNRSILNVIRKYGDEEAAKIVSGWSKISKPVLSAESLMRGRTAFASHFDRLFKSRHSASLRHSFPSQSSSVVYSPEYRIVEVLTEGKTDRIILEHFYREARLLPDYQDLRLVFPALHERGGFGDGALTKRLESLVSSGVRTMTVGLFDADNSSIMSKYSIGTGEFKPLSMASDFVQVAILPRPKGFDGSSFCIEHFFPREFIMRGNSHGRRLFYKDEFDDRTGRHRELDLYCRSEKKTLIIDDGVYGMANDNNVALSKAAFAQAVVEQNEPWADASVEWFYPIFDLLKEISTQ